MTLPLVVSFYTQDWFYPHHARRLIAECESLDLEFHVEQRASAGGYLENTCQKPTFIRECLERFERPILWIDVDGSIVKRPDYFIGGEWDFQARRMPPTRPRTWHVGTMYWSPSALPFVREWERLTGDMSDESSLEQAWRLQGHTLRARDIPQTYFEIPKRGESPTPECVIFHRLSDGASKREQSQRFNDHEKAEARARTA